VSCSKPEIKHISGDTFRRTWMITDDTDAPVNLTGASVLFRLVNIKTGAVVFEATLANAELVLTPLAGRVDFSGAIVTVPGVYQFGFKVTLAGVTTTYEQGQLTVLKGV
jgi:hypothetical protein